ncbi:hypothetical protein WME94_32365 [Sorangium sp. So ce429]
MAAQDRVAPARPGEAALRASAIDTRERRERRLQTDTMYGLIVRNSDGNPASNFFSFNMPYTDTAHAGPHARNELSKLASGALMSLDPREHVAWSANSGTTWSHGTANGQYVSYVNEDPSRTAPRRWPPYLAATIR